jgi:hypothetical protein
VKETERERIDRRHARQQFGRGSAGRRGVQPPGAVDRGDPGDRSAANRPPGSRRDPARSGPASRLEPRSSLTAAAASGRW